VLYPNQWYILDEQEASRGRVWPFTKFGVQIVGSDDLTPTTIRELTIVRLDGSGELVSSYAPGFFSHVEEARAWFKELRRVGHRAAYSLGSHRFDPDFFCCLRDHFSSRLDKLELKMKPHELFRFFILLSDCLIESRYRQRTDSVPDLKRILQEHAPDAWPTLAKSEPLDELLEFYIKHRGRFGEDPRDWVGVRLIGSCVPWWRYRTPLAALNNSLSMLTDLAGRVVQVDPHGGLVPSPVASDRARHAAQLIRGVLRVDHPVADSKLGDAYVDHEGRRCDTGTVVTLDEVRNGVDIGGVHIKGSIVLGSTIPKDSIIRYSVVDERRGPVRLDASAVLCSTGSRLLEADRALVYNVVHTKGLCVPGKVVTDVFRPGIRPTASEGLMEGQARVWAWLEPDGSAADAVVLPHGLSMKMLADMPDNPRENERVRQSVEKLVP
jgi:hypothetical protein